jgi:PAS domain S-box-containing protein
MTIEDLAIRRTPRPISPMGATSALGASAEFLAQHLAAIVESSDDAIISKDLDGTIQTWNRGAERVFGYSADEVIGKPVTVLMPPERIDEEPGILARIRRGERIDHYETVRRRKDGSLIDISLTVSPMRDAHGRVIGASKIARDITERKKAEDVVRENERRLQELFSSIPAAIYTTDALGKITYYNDAAVALAGRTPTLGSDEWCVTWKLYWPDGTPLRLEEYPMAIALKEGRAIRNAEVIAERPDGTRVPFIPYPTLLRDAHGKVVGAINMLVDISERRQAETQQRMLLRVLYATTDATTFQADEFLDAVCQSVQQTLPSEISILRASASGELSNDTAMPLALILNELLTNAAKHGADRSGECVIRVGLNKEGEHFTLYVEDDGPGFDLETVAKRSSGLGLVQGLAGQLRAQFEVTRSPVTRCTLRFP